MINKLYDNWLLAILALLMASLFGCDSVKSIDVIVPKNEPNTEALLKYKNDIFSRPLAMAMHYKWGLQTGYSLFELPDQIDVIVIKENSGNPSIAMLQDLKATQEVKGTIVLSSVDINEIDIDLSKALRKELKERRTALLNSWTEDNSPTEEEQNALISELEENTTKEFRAKGVEQAKALLTPLITGELADVYDGINIKFPETFGVLTAEDANALLALVPNNYGGKVKPYLSVESPYEEGRAMIEKATWVIYSRKVADLKLADFTAEAQEWSNNRFIVSADLSDKNNMNGFTDESVFTVEGLSRTKSIIYWSAPNKAGIAYFHTEVDAFEYEGGLPYKNLKEHLLIFMSQNK